jgi:hypothetical protein
MADTMTSENIDLSSWNNLYLVYSKKKDQREIK